MAWKNWGDHPIVVSIGVLAGFAGLIALGVTLFSEPKTAQKIEPTQKQTSGGSNSPNINNSNGSVNLNIDNSTKVESPSRKVPEFSGEIGSSSKSDAFREFVDQHDNKVVFLNVNIDGKSSSAEERANRVEICDKSRNSQCRDSSFLLYYKCSDDPSIGNAVGSCRGMNYVLNISADSNSLFSYVQGAYYLKGFWSVRANPGTSQGIRSATLTPVNIQDAK